MSHTMSSRSSSWSSSHQEVTGTDEFAVAPFLHKDEIDAVLRRVFSSSRSSSSLSSSVQTQTQVQGQGQVQVVLYQYTRSRAHRRAAATPPSVSSSRDHRRAGILDPTEMARIDFHSGAAILRYWLRTRGGPMGSRPRRAGTGTRTGTVWVQTLGETPTTTTTQGRDGNDNETIASLVVVDAASDPLQWDDEHEHVHEHEHESTEETDAAVLRSSLVDLEDLACTIESAVQRVRDEPAPPPLSADEREDDVAVVFESIRPLVTAHGAAGVVALLRRIRRSSSFRQRQRQRRSSQLLVFVPVRVESLTPTDHRRLEDESDTMVMVSEASLTVVRKHASTGKVTVEALPLRTKGGDLVPSSAPLAHRDDHSHHPTPVTAKATHHGKAGGSSSVTLTLDEGASANGTPVDQGIPTSTSTPTNPNWNRNPNPNTRRPRIYLQDDDPEFDDLDEEDPDDDLDL